MAKAVLLTNKIALKWQSQCGRYTVFISDTCYNKMIEMANNYYPNEVGTSLVGNYSKDGFDAYVIDVAPVCPDSKSSATFFYRGVKGLCTFFIALWQKNSGEKYYIGEWHSHPDGAPEPSSTDSFNQEAIAVDKKINCPESILLIIGGNIFIAPELRVFVYSRKRGRINLYRQVT